MHIDSLIYFYKVAKNGNISSVAKESHISQSALSQQIQKLENNLNVKLLNRNNKGVTLTYEGEILYKYSETIINSYEKMQEELYSSQNEKKLAYIESIESLSLNILPSVLFKLKNKFTNYNISLVSNEDSSQNLINNLADISLSYKKASKEINIISKIIGYDNLVLVGNSSFQDITIKKEDLKTLPLILLSDKTYLDEVIYKPLELSSNYIDSINLLYTTNSYVSCIHGVLSSNALTFVPLNVYKTFENSNLKLINTEDFNLSLPIFINYSEKYYKTNSEVIKYFKNTLKGYL